MGRRRDEIIKAALAETQKSIVNGEPDVDLVLRELWAAAVQIHDQLYLEMSHAIRKALPKGVKPIDCEVRRIVRKAIPAMERDGVTEEPWKPRKQSATAET